MESNPRDYGEQCRFDAFCKKVLRNEARAYLRNMKRQREREAFFSDLSQAELDKLCVVDRYPSDSIVFSSHGYDLHIDNELVAEAFAALPQMEQSILILHCTLDLADGEIGNLVGMSRSAVQRHRTKALQELREAFVGADAERRLRKMTEPIHKGKDLPPVWVIHAASGGDSEAMEQVLRYYDDYMSRLCTRTLYDKDGTPHVCVDTHMKRCLEIRLIRAVMHA